MPDDARGRAGRRVAARYASRKPSKPVRARGSAARSAARAGGSPRSGTGASAAQLVERERRVGPVAGVDEPGLEVRPLDDLAGEPLEPALASRGVDRIGRRLAVEQRRPARGSSSGRRASGGHGPARSRGSTSRSGGSGTPRRPAGCCAEQRVAVVVDDRDRRRDRGARRRRSVLEEVLVELEGVVLLGVGGRLGPADLEVLRRRAARRARSSRTSSARARRAPRVAVVGKRRMPRRARSSSVRLPGSSLTGSPGSRPRSIPSSAAAITPPSEMYGFALASLALSSRFVEPASSSQ